MSSPVHSEACAYAFIILFGVGSLMSVLKPLLWLLEPYIVYKAYLWGLHFIARPLTWEGDVDLFALTLVVLLALDAIVLPLVLLYCPALNDGKSIPAWMQRLIESACRVYDLIDNKVHKSTSVSWIRKTLHVMLLFVYYLVPFYVGGNLIMALVMALMYDILLWAQGLA